ncbi:MAG TPA: branched-chain amino acid ABC transporter permease [Acidimicrobiales bacterium]|nr:MAG: hypothetical protein B7Z69_02135 [Actinobacteria bacterium 21-73-9]HQU25408.1 branched-chain amino acid ABC transporter permease [Acidimicrobiales bacterium]
MSATLVPDVGRTVVRANYHPAILIGGTVVVAALFTAAPWFLPVAWVSVLNNFFLLLIMATMWNLLAGYAGMVSIGQQGFIGLGSYALLYLALKGMNPFAAIPLAALIAGAIAVPVTFLLFRLRGGYFSVATWVVADSAMLVILSISYLGGGTGRPMPGLTSLSPSEYNHDSYLATWLTALVVSVGTYLLLRSRLGLVLASMRDNETAARSSGAKVTSTRRWIFVIAAMGCGAAGAVLAISQPFVQPGNAFNINWLAEMLFATIIGGIGTVEGPIIGTIVYFVLYQSLQGLGAWYLIIFGALAVAVALWQPGGVWGLVRDKTRFELLPVGYRVRER